MIQVVIADDHAIVRTGLQFIFDTTNDIELVAECRNGDELMDWLSRKNADLVILDIAMPGTDAFTVLEHLKKHYKELPVIIFTMNSDKAFAIRMFKNGADAFINKESDPKLLLESIRTVINGKKFQTPEQSQLMFEYLSNPVKHSSTPHDLLTDREFQILCMLATGMKKNEIANNLKISKNTVNNHRNNIMNKMGFESVAELTRYALAHHLIG